MKRIVKAIVALTLVMVLAIGALPVLSQLGDGTVSAYAAEHPVVQAMDLTNNQRTTNGLPALAICQLLMDLAAVRAGEIAREFEETGRITHYRPPFLDDLGRAISTADARRENAGGWVARNILVEGDTRRRGGENLSWGSSPFSPSETVTGWMNSTTGHREAILDNHADRALRYTRIGMASFTRMIDGQVWTFWVQLFANGTPIHWTSRIVPAAPLAPPSLAGGFTITFNLAGGSRTGGGEAVQIVDLGRSADPPRVSRYGFVFDGWSPAGGYRNVGSSRTVTAQWVRDENFRPARNDRERNLHQTARDEGSSVDWTRGDITTITAANAQAMVQQAIRAAAGTTTPVVQLRNPGIVSGAVFHLMTNEAQGGAILINADSIAPSPQNAGVSVLDVRIVLNPAQVVSSLNLSGSTGSPHAVRVQGLFQEHFGGTVSVVSLGQQGDFGGIEVRVVARVSPHLNINNMSFFSYNSATNTFRRFTPREVFLDSSGFLHFTTEYAGDIIITNAGA